ncbi:MAG: L-lysine 6-transaminase [bacterium]
MTQDFLTPEEVIPTIRRRMIGDGFEFVLDLERSQGSRLWDALRGRWLIDFYSCFASNPLGFNHPKMKDQAFTEKLLAAALHNVTNSDLFTTLKAEFVRTFWEKAVPPEGEPYDSADKRFRYMFLVAGGAPAVENALKTAFDWKQQINHQRGETRGLGRKVLHLTRSFHGRLGYTLSLTNTDPLKTDRFPTFSWPRIDAPIIHFPEDLADPRDLERREAWALDQARASILREGADIAACIVEPIQGEGGDNHFRGEFLRALQNLCREHDILFILDEVQTGLGLTGKIWAYQHFDLQPDILVFGKKTQVCGILVTSIIDRVEHHVFNTSGRINSTWGGNLADMVRCTRYLEIIEEDNLLENVQVMGKYLLERLNELRSKFPQWISNVRGRGLMCALDLPSGKHRDELRKALFENGMLILGCGERTLRFRPTLNITQEELNEGIAILEKTLKELQ